MTQPLTELLFKDPNKRIVLDAQEHTVKAIYNDIVIYTEQVPDFATHIRDDICNSARTRALHALTHAH